MPNPPKKVAISSIHDACGGEPEVVTEEEKAERLKALDELRAAQSTSLLGKHDGVMDDDLFDLLFGEQPSS